MIDHTVHIDSADHTLEGTLTLPAPETTDALISVLLIAGSGPLDRDQNSAKGKLDIFNDVANHLAEAGIASLRYDKRGCGNSEGDFHTTGHSDLVEDACACARFLQQHTRQSASLYLLGHSEGTLIAPQVIAKTNGIAGQVLLAPFIEPFTRVIKRQAESSLAEIKALPGFKGIMMRFFLALAGDQLAKQDKLINRINASSDDIIKLKKQVINAKWIREMVALDATEIHAQVTLPTLAIGGTKDLQCLPADTEALSTIVNGPIDTHLIADMNHILRRDPEKPSIQHYTQLAKQPVDAELLSIVTDWLQAQS